MTIKWHYQSILIPLQQLLWTCCIFLSSINNTFFSVLVITFSNMSYFCFNYTNTFFHSYHELFFSGTLNCFSNVYGESFFHWAENYFSQCRELILGLQCLWALQLKWSGLSLWLHWATVLKTLKWRSAFKENATVKHCQGKKEKRFSSLLQNLSAVISLCVHDEVFWTEDLIEETMKRLHDSYTILTLIEHDMSAQLNSSLPNLIPRVLVLYYTCWLSERRCSELESPYPELQEGSPNSNPDGRA